MAARRELRQGSTVTVPRMPLVILNATAAVGMAVLPRLQRFPVILDHQVIQYDREAPSILVLAHVLVGKPDPPSGQALGHASPGHARPKLACRSAFESTSAHHQTRERCCGGLSGPIEHEAVNCTCRRQ
jgi:hypothetical protein